MASAKYDQKTSCFGLKFEMADFPPKLARGSSVPRLFQRALWPQLGCELTLRPTPMPSSRLSGAQAGLVFFGFEMAS